MHTYTEEEVIALVQERLHLLAAVEVLKDDLQKANLEREIAEKKYSKLCEDCIKTYVTQRDIEVDALFVQVHVPVFMSNEDFETALTQQIISHCRREREKVQQVKRESLTYMPKQI